MIDLKKQLHLRGLIVLNLVLAACSNPDPDKDADKSTFSAENGCITRVIAIDDSLGNIRNHASETVPLSKAINQYTNAMQKVSFQSCPQEFKENFEKHLEAWQNMVKITDKYSGYRGEMHELFKKIESEKDSTEFKIRLKAIWNTWGKVEKAIPA